MLHVVEICAEGYVNAPMHGLPDGDRQGLSDLLDAQLWGLLPGFHRLVFEGGMVLLTLCVGEVQTVLRQQRFLADAIVLSGPIELGSPHPNHALFTIKAIAKLCKHGALLTAPNAFASKAALAQCGFEIVAQTDAIKAIYRPAWRVPKLNLPVENGTCVILGAGLAGAAVASSLARRGWTVTVLDAASEPASGASSLPAGLLVPHTSPDDSQLSRLSRAGVRITLQQAHALLRAELDWARTGVLQRNFDDEELHLPRTWTGSNLHISHDWCHPANAQTLAAAGLHDESSAIWHKQAGWIKPGKLVGAWLKTPGITWQGQANAVQIAPLQSGQNAGWQVLGPAGEVLAEANLVVLAASYASQALAASAGASLITLQAVRGQVTLGTPSPSRPLPPFAVNGHGGLIPAIPTVDGTLWLMGAGYERDALTPVVNAADHLENLARLQRLLPTAASALGEQFNGPNARGWAGIRCATPTRLPLVANLSNRHGRPGLWVCTGMGSRGLSFAALCGELLAAWLHNEPLPIDRQLASLINKNGRKQLSNL